MRQIRDLRRPLITQVNGAAVGVGASLALLGDIIIAGSSAYFLQAFRKIGLVPDGGAAFLLAKSAGRVRAMEAMLLAERIPAEKALEWGLVTRVVQDEVLNAVVGECAAELAKGPAFAMQSIRRLAWRALHSDFDQILDCERNLQREAASTSDFKEGVAAFAERRAPVFKSQ